MYTASWLWQTLHPLFAVDDGSLPEIWVTYIDPNAVVGAYELLQSRSSGLVGRNDALWLTVRNAEVPWEDIPNSAALVVSGEVKPFHVVFGGIQSNGVVLPDIGARISSDQIVLDYRMGSEWSEAKLDALFEILRALMNLDPRASLSLEEYVLPQVQTDFKRAWERWCADHSA